VKRVDLRNNSPVIILSRTDTAFLANLLEQEVPEIFDGSIVIRNIVREPGEKAKVVVESFDDRIDPGRRLRRCRRNHASTASVRELRNENIDILNHTNNQQLMVQRALAPAKVIYYRYQSGEKAHISLISTLTRYLWPSASVV
jgi:N utilization substance protein A